MSVVRARLLLPLASVLPLVVWLPLASHARGASAATSLPRVTFVAAPGSSVLVHGTYPVTPSPCVRRSTPVFHERLSGTVEVGKATDGSLFVIDQLPFEDYVKGIAEVPRTWPMAALKAQAVAARSYALANLAYPDPVGEELGYQLCATAACQVYSGLAVPNGPYGERWRAAVNDTAGQILMYQGRPADTLYFSTSNGRTVGNDTVFGTAPLPYLRPVAEHDDGASPLSRWEARISIADVQRFLSRAGHWTHGGTLRSARTSGSADVVLKASTSPRTRRVSVSTFRDAMNSWASCLDPSSYPGLNHDNGTALPQTVPSNWFSMRTSGGVAVLDGRGWGHGVGMVQWGAYGKAKRGLSYRQILSAYYGGLQPVDFAEPATIRVGVVTGLSSVEVEGTGPVTAEGTKVAAGPWRITGGRRLRAGPGPSPPVYLRGGSIRRCPKRSANGGRIEVRVDVPELSVLRLLLAPANGSAPAVPIARARTAQRGTQTVAATIPRDTITGRYLVTLEVTNGTDIVDSKPRRIRIDGVASPIPVSPPSSRLTSVPGALRTPTRSRHEAARVGVIAGGIVVFLLVAAGAVLTLRRRSRAPAGRAASRGSPGT